MKTDALRIARFLAMGTASCAPAAKPDKLSLTNGRGAIAAPFNVVADMARRGLIEQSAGKVALTESGAAFAQRHVCGEENFQNQHRKVVQKLVDVDGLKTVLRVNQSESPLSAIARRKDRRGKSFLTSEEFEAGERLRSDYTRGQLIPGIGANWRAPIASGRRSGERGGAAELTDVALAARQRVENAVRAVGPELSGVLLDICCYLKGLDLVERERGWPARSAKVVLKTALGALARHYLPESANRNAHRPTMLHWGAADYRPNIA
jgi:hypothetical protein